MTRALFVCSQNKLRSPTAEQVFSTWPGVETCSAGLNNDAVTPLSSDLIEWADLIFVMETNHKNKLSKKFRPFIKNKKVIILGIPDEFDFMDQNLVNLLIAHAGPWLKP